jgi:hypothetical protein
MLTSLILRSITRRRVRVRQPVQRGVRDADDGAEHGALQQRRHVRRLLHHRLRRPAVALLQAGRLHHRHRHQPLPAQLGAGRRPRRLVQPAAPALRHVAAGVGVHRRLPRRDRSGELPPRAVPARRRRPVHRRRAKLLRAGDGGERGRQRRGGAGLDQGRPDGLDGHDPELGRQLAEQRLPQRAEPLVPPPVRRRPHRHGQQRRPPGVVVRRHLHVQCPVLLTTPDSIYSCDFLACLFFFVFFFLALYFSLS